MVLLVYKLPQKQVFKPFFEKQQHGLQNSPTPQGSRQF